MRSEVVAHAVAFDVGFVHNVEPIAVAEGVPIGVVGIVRGADGVEVVGLEGADVLLHGGLVDDVAVYRMVLVAVDALDEDGLSVDFDQAFFDADVAEADLQAGGFKEVGVTVLEGDGEVVQRGGFGRPRGDRRQAVAPGAPGGVPWGNFYGQGRSADFFAASGKGADEAAAERRLSAEDHIHGHGYIARSEIVLQTGVHCDVGEVGCGTGVEPDFAFDARQPPEILAFEEAAIAPPVDFQGEGVFSPFARLR